VYLGKWVVLERIKKLLSGVGEENASTTAAEEASSSAGVGEEPAADNWR
jgi:hypothetical protein